MVNVQIIGNSDWYLNGVIQGLGLHHFFDFIVLNIVYKIFNVIYIKLIWYYLKIKVIDPTYDREVADIFITYNMDERKKNL